jgi:AraC-like DNA-binding protein
MRIARVGYRWRLVAVGHVVHDCLETLALAEGYRVGAVCERLGVSQPYFREMFVRDVGLPPKVWMQWERMVVARRMLSWGVEPEEISELLGFSQFSSFRREFREVYGVQPGDFVEMRRPEMG